MHCRSTQYNAYSMKMPELYTFIKLIPNYNVNDS